MDAYAYGQYLKRHKKPPFINLYTQDEGLGYKVSASLSVADQADTKTLHKSDAVRLKPLWLKVTVHCSTL